VVQTRDESTTGGSWTYGGLFSEYRYDPLGRRIMVRTRRDGTCTTSVSEPRMSTITHFIWSGDQVLWQLRAPGGDEDNLGATTGTGTLYGRVSYFHAGGIDRR
jgi:hypothetical protein